MSTYPVFGGPALSECALGRKTPLVRKDSECVVHMRMSEPVSVWDMDHEDIEKGAENAATEKADMLRRCDFAVYQAENPRDEKSHLVLVECKRQFRESEEELKKDHSQLVGGLRVLLHMAGEGNRKFDLLNPVIVYGHEGEYRNAAMSGNMDSPLHKMPIEYNGRKARIKVRRTGVEIDDKFVAVKGARQKG